MRILIKRFNYERVYRKKIGIDKFAHLGVGGLLCAMVTFVVLLQEMGNLTTGMILTMPVIGTVAVMFLEFLRSISSIVNLTGRMYYILLSGVSLYS